MRAFSVKQFGEAPAIGDLPLPASDSTFLVRVRYAGVNPIDYKLLGQLTATSTYPFVMGLDFAGSVERVPNGRNDFNVGDRVFGIARTHGSYAEYTAVAPDVKTEPLTRIPDRVTDEQAAALPIPAITALGSLDLLNLTAGEHVVVMGATGAVGGYAVQLARSRGAHVIAIVHGDSDEARRLGAQEVYDSKSSDAIDALRASHPGGVDAVLDLVNGKDAIERDADVLKPGGRLVSTVYAADEAWFSQRNIAAHNIASTKNPYSSPEGLNEVARLLAAGTITARIGSTFALEDAGKMLEELRGGGLRGKTLLRA